MPRTQSEIRAALRSRPKNALQVFDEAAVVRSEKDFYCSFPNFGDRVTLVKEFHRRPGLNADIQNAAEATRMIVDPDFEVLGTNMTSALVTFDAEGGIKLTTAGADDDQAILLPHLDTNQTVWSGTTWGTDREVEWGLLVKPTQITATQIWAGLKKTNTSVLGTDTDQAYFQFSTEGATSTANWTCIYSIGGTDYEIDSGVAVEAGVCYDLRVIIDADRIARFYINGVLVCTSLALTDAVDLIPYAGVQSLVAATAKAMTVRKVAISRKAA